MLPPLPTGAIERRQRLRPETPPWTIRHTCGGKTGHFCRKCNLLRSPSQRQSIREAARASLEAQCEENEGRPKMSPFGAALLPPGVRTEMRPLSTDEWGTWKQSVRSADRAVDEILAAQERQRQEEEDLADRRRWAMGRAAQLKPADCLYAPAKQKTAGELAALAEKKRQAAARRKKQREEAAMAEAEAREARRLAEMELEVIRVQAVHRAGSDSSSPAAEGGSQSRRGREEDEEDEEDEEEEDDDDDEEEEEEEEEVTGALVVGWREFGAALPVGKDKTSSIRARVLFRSWDDNDNRAISLAEVRALTLRYRRCALCCAVTRPARDHPSYWRARETSWCAKLPPSDSPLITLLLCARLSYLRLYTHTHTGRCGDEGGDGGLAGWLEGPGRQPPEGRARRMGRRMELAPPAALALLRA